MKKINMLDCTLRDGGWVNHFCFGTEAMKALMGAVESSGVEYIELGYLDLQNGSPEGRSEFSDMAAVSRLLEGERRTSQAAYLVMIDYGKYPVQQLPPCSETKIDGIRLCFHKKDADGAIQMGREILRKGYRLLMQPMVCTRYTDREFERLLLQVGERLEKVWAFYIVDSFGAMDSHAVLERMTLADRLLQEGVCLGLHTHNNMGLSFRNAAASLELKLGRELLLDSTLAGIGKGAGNLDTEQFAAYLNENYGKSYDLASLKEGAKIWIRPLQKNYTWGYCAEYLLSAQCCVTPSYAKVFCQEYHLPVEQVKELLVRIPDEKKDSFDRSIAERILKEYQEEKGREELW